MKIGIDARLIYETGVGRYIRNLIDGLADSNTSHEYYVYLTKDGYSKFRVPSDSWHKRVADVRWHTVKEQIVLPRLFAHDSLDLLHVPYFTIPLLYDGLMVATIHDLTVLHIKTGKASTRVYPFYLAKRFGYHAVLYFGLSKCTNIISVSQTTKEELLSHFRINPGKIHVTHEGIDRIFLSDEHVPLGSFAPSLPYFLYVGNAYPHKNLTLLLKAFSLLEKDVQKKCKLVFVGSEDIFYRRTIHEASHLGIDQAVELRSSISDSQLKALYQHAIAFLFPSCMEGFGLPPLEALSSGCPVLVSDIPIFDELLPASVLRLPPDNPDAWAKEMNKMLQKDYRKQHLPSTSSIVSLRKTYSWDSCARKTLKIYELCNRV